MFSYYHNPNDQVYTWHLNWSLPYKMSPTRVYWSCHCVPWVEVQVLVYVSCWKYTMFPNSWLDSSCHSKMIPQSESHLVSREPLWLTGSVDFHTKVIRLSHRTPATSLMKDSIISEIPRMANCLLYQAYHVIPSVIHGYPNGYGWWEFPTRPPNSHHMSNVHVCALLLFTGRVCDLCFGKVWTIASTTQLKLSLPSSTTDNVLILLHFTLMMN